MAFSVWNIEREPGYLAFLKERNKDYPVFKATPGKHSQRRDGSYRIDRTLVVAEERKNVMWVGVVLSDDSHYWTDYPEQNFTELLMEEVKIGYNMKLGSSRDWFPEWLANHDDHQIRLEYCSSHIGGFVRVACSCGETVYIDEC
jgi:hypothetical protein